MEFLTCPGCKNRIKTAKLLQFADEKRVKCEKCSREYTLGEARQLGKQVDLDVLAVLEGPFEPAQNRSISSRNDAFSSENSSISVPLTQLEYDSPLEVPIQARFCPHCRQKVPLDASKCGSCHEWLDGRVRPLINSGIAAILSFLIPGLGQACQRRIFVGIICFTIPMIAYCSGFWPIGLLIHLAIVIEAAIYNHD